MTRNDNDLTLDVDSFLDALGLRADDVQLRTPAMRDSLFRICKEYLGSKSLGETHHEINESSSEANLRLPRTAIIVRLSQPTEEELKGIIMAAAALILATGKTDAQTISLAASVSLFSRIKHAKKKYGQVSILDAVQRVQRSTIDSISNFLYGNPCRYASADCRFRSDDAVCLMDRESVTSTVEGMIKGKLLVAKNDSEPIEYGIAF